MLKNKTLIILMTLLITLTQLNSSLCALDSYAQTKYTDFSDLPSSHWAYNAIQWMNDNKIISGYPDNTFKPNKVVTRAEFAVIMVKALNLSLKTPQDETFMDMPKDNWAYSYVESAKYYLTGFRSNDGDRFWPNRESVREDMAVALVKAMKYQEEEIDESILNTFKDKASISPQLRKYVAIAVKHNIMKGNPIENSSLKAFRPQNFLTRAEAAVLIYNTLQMALQEEKITYDEYLSMPATEENIGELELNNGGIYNYSAPQVQGKVVDGKVVLNWTKASENGFLYYKVVASKSNSSPRYPQDGYLYVISDRSQTSVTLKSTDSYSGGDIQGKLVPGQSYYFSITAVYNDAKVPGNTVSLKYPSASDVSSAVKVTGKVSDGKILLQWTPVSSSGFNYYKVVISKNVSNPRYPDDGYLYYFSDVNKTSCVIDNGSSYNGGDFGKYLEPGQKYYFSITAVYDNKKIVGNAVQLTYPSNTTSSSSTVKVTGKVSDGKILLQWTPVSSSGFNYYKVVISKDVSNPKYPEDGYLYYFTDVNKTSCVIDNSSSYNGGSFGEYLIPGQKYYFSITAVFGDRKIVGNAVQLTYPK